VSVFATEESARVARDLLKRVEDLLQTARMAAEYSHTGEDKKEFLKERSRFLEDFRRWEIMELIR
jgi:hypothetical protein